MVNDPIADLLTRLRNGYMAKRETVDVPHSAMKYSICKILEKHGFIEGMEMNTINDHKNIVVTLKTLKKNDTLLNFKRMSKPGRRLYVGTDDLKMVNSGFGIGIISTSKGLMTNNEARHAKLGGEYLCQVY